MHRMVMCKCTYSKIQIKANIFYVHLMLLVCLVVCIVLKQPKQKEQMRLGGTHDYMALFAQPNFNRRKRKYQSVYKL